MSLPPVEFSASPLGWSLIAFGSNTATTDNGALPVTHRDFHKYGIRWSSIGAAIREAEALGWIKVMRWGIPSTAEFHVATLFALTHLAVNEEKPTDEWREIKTMKEGKMKMKEAHNAPAQYGGLAKTKRPKNVFLIPKRELTSSQNGSLNHQKPTPISGSLCHDKTGSLSIVWVGTERSEAVAGIGHNQGPALDDDAAIAAVAIQSDDVGEIADWIAWRDDWAALAYNDNRPSVFEPPVIGVA